MKIQFSFKSDKNSQLLYTNTNIHFYHYFTEFFFRMRIFSDKCCRGNQNTHFTFSNVAHAHYILDN